MPAFVLVLLLIVLHHFIIILIVVKHIVIVLRLWLINNVTWLLLLFKLINELISIIAFDESTLE